MWLPTPIYERITQFWVSLGLLLIGTGLLFGFQYQLAFWYVGIGAFCCMYGVGIFLYRLRQRGRTRPAGQRIAPAG